MVKKLVFPAVTVLAGFLILMMIWMAAGARLQVQGAQKAADRTPIVLADRAPIRRIYDPYPTFEGIALDENRGEVFVGNDNRGSTRSVLVYRAEFQPTDKVMEPLRRIAGPKTHLGAICGVAVDPDNKELYVVNPDGGDNMTVFPFESNGNVGPARELNVAHGAWGIFIDQKHDELFVTSEHVNKVSVYRRTADGDEDPVRYIQGPNTEMADPHGIVVDSERNEVFVTNHGNWHKTVPGEGYQLFGEGKLAHARGSQSHAGVPEPLGPSTGKFMPPSITVYSRTAQGDVKPLRVIQGSQTQLEVPLGLFPDSATHQIAVANAGNDAILFFDINASGNVGPVRVLKGPATELKSPTGIFIDNKRNELWVTNWDGHTVTIFPRNAQGNAAPLRVLRSGPASAPATGFGGGAFAYDPKRDEILAAN